MRWQSIPILFFIPVAMAQSGVITTIAGTTRGYGGDGGIAVRAQFTLADVRNECDPGTYEELSHISVDRGGNIYVADTNNNRIRRIAPDGVITTVAGTGARPPIETAQCSPLGGDAETGDGGPATSAKLYGPSQAIVLANGVMLITDQKNNRIRQVTPQGTITTVVGTSRHSVFPPNFPANLAPLDWPSSIAVDAQNRGHFAELHSHRIARANSDGRLQVIAGTGLPNAGADGPDATRSALSKPVHILFDAAGNLLVAEQGSHRIRRISPNGAIVTVAGNGTPGFSGDGGRATAAQLNQPNAVAVDAAGNIYIADMGNHRVRRVTPDGTITTIAGNGQAGRGSDGVAATESALNIPCSVAVDANGDVLILDWQNYRIRKVTFGTRPVVAAGGVVNAASFAAAPVAPGGLVSIFGTNFAAQLTQASAVPLPLELGGVRVALDGTPLPLVFVSPGQINAQLPYGLREGNAMIQVTGPGGMSDLATVRIIAAAPGIFRMPGGNRGVVVNQNGALNTPETPEGRGRVLTVFLTGIGELDGTLEAGAAAPGNVLYRAAATVTATIGERTAEVLFTGLTPGFVGLAQANIVVPAEAATADSVPLTVRVGGQASDTVQVAVR